MGKFQKCMNRHFCTASFLHEDTSARVELFYTIHLIHFLLFFNYHCYPYPLPLVGSNFFLSIFHLCFLIITVTKILTLGR